MGQAGAPGNYLEGKTLPSGKKLMLVYYIGGVTFMEVAAMRFLSKSRDFPYQIIICTTKLVNGNTFVMSSTQVSHQSHKRVKEVRRPSAQAGGGARRGR